MPVKPGTDCKLEVGIDPRGRSMFMISVDARAEWLKAHKGIEPPPNMQFTNEPVATTNDPEYALWITNIAKIKESMAKLMAIVNNDALDMASKVMQAQGELGTVIAFLGTVEKAAKEIEIASATQCYKLRQEALKAGLMKPNK